jgi:hypothetical protein
MKQLIILSLLCGFCTTSTFGQTLQVPPLVNYQGRLTSASGEALGSGAFSLEFSVYSQAAGGSPVWGPHRFPSVPVVNGNFNIILGPTDETNRLLQSAWLQGESYLGLRVNGGPEVVPRQKILSSPYALVSGMGVPVGSIIPWVPPRRVASLDEARGLLPAGFLICDGPKPDDPKTVFDEGNIPDLRDQTFLKGVSPDAERIGSLGGTNSHSHSFSGSTLNEYPSSLSRPYPEYSDYAASALHRHTFSGVTASTNWIPKSISVIYVIRVN